MKPWPQLPSDPRLYYFAVPNGMLLKGTLNDHLQEIDRQANEMMERLTTQIVQAEGVTEQLKATDQMGWVRHMNNIKERAEEIARSELIYR